MVGMRRVAPYLIFAAFSLFVLREPIFFGRTLFATDLIRGTAAQGAREEPMAALYPHLLVYNQGLHRGEVVLWNPLLRCGYPSYYNPLFHPFYPPNLIAHRLLSLEAAYHALVLLHLFFAGVAMYWFLRKLDVKEVAAIVGALGWMGNSYALTWLPACMLMSASVFLPLALMFLAGAASMRPVAAAALCAGAIWLGSHPQIALFSCIVIFAFALFTLPGPIRWKGSAALAGIAALVSAVAVLGRIDSITHTVRNPLADVEAVYGRPDRVFANVIGVFFPISQHGAGSGELMMYQGLAMQLIAAFSVLSLLSDRRKVFFLVLAGLGFAFAFLPPVARLLANIPLLGLALPARWLFVTSLAMAVLVAHGVDELLSNPLRKRALLIGIAVVISVLGAAHLLTRPVSPQQLVVVLTSVGGVIALIFLAKFHEYVAVGTMLVDLSILAVTLVPSYESIQPGEFKLARAAGSRLGAESPIGANFTIFEGFENAGGYEAVTMKHFAAFAAQAGAAMDTTGRTIAFDQETPQLSIANVKYFLKGAQTIERATLPRAYVVPKVVTGDDIRKIDPAREVLGPAPFEAPPGERPVMWQERSPNRLQLEATGPGVLVLSEVYHPGWIATVDGRSAEVFRANVAFRGIPLGPGDHTIEMRFAPLAVTRGAFVSILGLLLAIFTMVRRPKPPQTSAA